jgi:putative FmdB family regulatory protein
MMRALRKDDPSSERDSSATRVRPRVRNGRRPPSAQSLCELEVEYEMPIYEYLCESCGHEFETLQKVSDAPLRECPSCHQERLVKKVTAAGFRLKGGGWYETDFKSGSKRNVAGEGGSSGAAESKSGGDSAASSTTTASAD